jgi:hypothetical protein
MWRAIVCFLLAGLFLYNPFLAGHRENAGLAVCHPASHRATVGSSELEQFPQRHQAVAPLPEPDAARYVMNPSCAAPFAALAAADRDELLVRERWFSSSLWFRPPPAV